MTKDEALKLALEALEEINQLSIGENAVCLPAEIDTAMDAIKEALAQDALDRKAENARELGLDYEPVAFASHGVVNWIADKQFQHEADLYTTSQRKPLTDEEIDKAWRSCDYTVPWEQHRIDIARAIEAAHGIKE